MQHWRILSSKSLFLRYRHILDYRSIRYVEVFILKPRDYKCQTAAPWDTFKLSFSSSTLHAVFLTMPWNQGKNWLESTLLQIRALLARVTLFEMRYNLFNHPRCVFPYWGKKALDFKKTTSIVLCGSLPKRARGFWTETGIINIILGFGKLSVVFSWPSVHTSTWNRSSGRTFSVICYHCVNLEETKTKSQNLELFLTSLTGPVYFQTFICLFVCCNGY